MQDVIRPHNKKRAAEVADPAKLPAECSKIQLKLDSGAYDVSRGWRKDETKLIAHGDISYTPLKILFVRSTISRYAFNTKWLINPRIVSATGEQECLQHDVANPNKSAKVIKRYDEIVVEFMNHQGKSKRGRCGGVVAGLIQQGIERFDGVSITDTDYDSKKFKA